MGCRQARKPDLRPFGAVEEIAGPFPAGPRIRQLASEAAALDPTGIETKFAIVAPSSILYGLAREYQIYRELDPRSKKEVGVFRTLKEALSFLGIETLGNPEFCRVKRDS